MASIGSTATIARPERDELPRELARARGEVEHVASRADAEPLRDPGHRLVRIAGPRPLVDLRGGREAGFGRRMQAAHWGVMRYASKTPSIWRRAFSSARSDFTSPSSAV